MMNPSFISNNNRRWPTLLLTAIAAHLSVTTFAGEVKFSLSPGSDRSGTPVINLNVCGTLDLGLPLVYSGGDSSSFDHQPFDFMGITTKEDDEGIKMQGSCQRQGSAYPCDEYASEFFHIPSNQAAGVSVDMRDCENVDFRLLQSTSPLLPWHRVGFDIDSRSPDTTRIEVPPIADVNATSLVLEGSTVFDSAPTLGNLPVTLENLQLSIGAHCFMQWKTDEGGWQRISLVVEDQFKPCSNHATFDDVAATLVEPKKAGPLFRLGDDCWCPVPNWLGCLLMGLSFALTGDCPTV